ncbi:DNA-binding SARP family transcriptional activator [Crossiella equi]|uniref:DNA-binding SARP family transcriptional activator n=1 Tax=Crossiella equi TaxID=130796 RepID=A0ABS5A9Z0_9PSEU|nr:AfsR/SARP family transcriptional regulator [Crossiella equi]MBP2473102.1 DNA-binding SARP family transcriptional activator [Crossiella equi]
MTALYWRVLGPLEVHAADGPLALGGAKQRAVLAELLVEAGRTVSVDRLVDGVWGAAPPRTAVSTLRSYVANLRRALEPGRPPATDWQVLTSSPIGYCLRAGRTDAGEFTRLVEAGRAALADGRARQALADLGRALDLWRGPAYGEFPTSPAVAAAARRLEDLRLATEEDHAAAGLATGDSVEAAAALRRLVGAEPLRERRWELLATALYQSGRQAEALTALREARELLVRELGVDPGPALRDLEKAILDQEPALITPPVPAAPAVVELPGRGEVLARLDGVLDEARRGRGGLALVTGEPGIGKSRLAQAVVERARDFAVAVGRCPDGEGTPALWPWTMALRGLGQAEDRLGDSPTPAEARSGSAPPGTGPAAAPWPGGLLPLVDAVVAAARAQPLLLVLEDLHWADPDSVRALRLLTTALPELPLLVLVTSREGADLTGPAADLVGGLTGAGVHRLPLRPLGESEVAAVLRGLLGERPEPELAARVHRRCGGNPFHVGELARLVAEDGPDAVTDGLPERARDLIEHRLRRLPDGAVATLVTAAVLGEEFDLGLLAETDGSPPARTLGQVDAGVRWGLLAETAPVGRYRFGHALVRDTLRRSVSGPHLAATHARVAAALHRRRPVLEEAPDELVDALAFHWLAAVPVGHAEQAVTAAAEAARRAEKLFAHKHSAALLAAAVEVVDSHLPPHDEAGLRRLFGLLVDLGRARSRDAEHEEARAPLERAIALARTLGDPVALAVAATVHSIESLWATRAYFGADQPVLRALADAARLLPATDSPMRALVLASLAAERYFDPSVPTAEIQADSTEAVAIARRIGDDDLLLRVLHLRHQAIRHASTLTERRALVDEQARLAAKPGTSPHWQPMVLLRRALTALEAGQMRAAQADIDACAAANEHTRLPEVEVHLRWWKALRAGLAGQTEVAGQLARQAYELHRTTVWGPGPALMSHRVSLLLDQEDFTQIEAVVRAGRGGPVDGEAVALALALLGRHTEAAAHCPPAAQWTPPREDWLWLLRMVLAAYTWVLGGDAASCRWALRRLLPYAGRTVTTGSAVFCWGSIDFFLGELAAVAGDTGLAASLMASAARHNGELGALRWQERAVARLAELGANGVPTDFQSRSNRGG